MIDIYNTITVSFNKKMKMKTFTYIKGYQTNIYCYYSSNRHKNKIKLNRI